jgi:lipopolysaccharide export system protein LptC
VTALAAPAQRLRGRQLVRAAWERISVYLPVILMGVMALGTYWLARNTPILGPGQPQSAPTHEPDYYMRGFSVKTFDAAGRVKSEIYGTEARHYPDTDTLEIDQPRIRSFNDRGEITVATAKRALSNGDGSEVQLMGDAVVTREAITDADGRTRPRLQFRGEFLHAFMDTERVQSHLPVELSRGQDKFTGDSMDFDNITQVLDLRGRVKGVIMPGVPGTAR